MGIRSRFKKTLHKIRVLAKVIHEESKYPGRPQPHDAAKNPLWGGGDSRGERPDLENPEQESDNAYSPKPSSQEINEKQGSLDEEGADYWFLQYDDVEGWNESNPGQKKPKE